MPATLVKKGSILLAKGIDSSVPGEYIQDQFATNSINMNLVEGLISKRRGYSSLGGVISGIDLEIMNGTIFRREDADYNIRIGLDAIEKFNVGTQSWDIISSTSLNGATDNLVSLATPLLSGQPILCITNSIDDIIKWESSGLTSALGGTPPKCKFIQEYKTYLVCANITGGIDVAQRVQWSDTLNPEMWTGGNSGARDLEEDNGDITGLNLFGDYLCVHKENSIYLGYLINTDNIFQFDRKNTGVGTIANNSIVNLPTGEQIFVAQDGIRIFTGLVASLIDSPINDEIRRSINQQYAFKSWGLLVKNRDEVWLGIPTGSESAPQTIYKFNYVKRIVYKDVVENVTVGWVGSSDASVTWDQIVGTWDENPLRWNDTALNQGATVINLGRNDGYVIASDDTSTSDSSLAINAFYDSKDFQDSQEGIIRVSELQLWAKGTGTVNVLYSVDEGQTWTDLTNSPITLSDEFPDFGSPQMLYLDVCTSKIRFRFQNQTATDTLYIKQFIVGYKIVGFRR